MPTCKIGPTALAKLSLLRLETAQERLAFAERSFGPEASRGVLNVLMLLLIATLIGGAIGFAIGLIYGGLWSVIGAQLGATIGVLVAATVRGLR